MELNALYAEVAERTMLGLDRLAAFVRAAERMGPGSIAEVGVRDGGTARFLARLYPDRMVFAFDTFEGMPVNDDGFPVGDYAARPDTVAWLSEVPNIIVVEGIFPQEGLPASAFTGQLWSLVHLDADLYQTTRDGLLYFWPRLDGVLVLDDFNRPECPGVRRAVEECLPTWRDHVIEHQPQWCQLVLGRRP